MNSENLSVKWCEKEMRCDYMSMSVSFTVLLLESKDIIRCVQCLCFQSLKGPLHMSEVMWCAALDGGI